MDFYQGQTITRLDVAPLGAGRAGAARHYAGSRRPVQYYASPALAALLRTVPADELGDRFPGHLAGTIGDAALNGANDLVIYVGYTPAALHAVPAPRGSRRSPPRRRGKCSPRSSGTRSWSASWRCYSRC